MLKVGSLGNWGKRQHILLVSIETPGVCGERYIIDDLKFYVIICSGSGSEDYRLKMADSSVLEHFLLSTAIF